MRVSIVVEVLGARLSSYLPAKVVSWRGASTPVIDREPHLWVWLDILQGWLIFERLLLVSGMSGLGR